MDWFAAAITFDCDDHPDYVPNPGVYPLVVDPVIANTRLTKVLMDGGSSLNIIYSQTLDLLGVERARLQPSVGGFTPFFLVYGSEAMLPTDIEYGSPRLKAYSERNNDAAREDALDQLEEAWDVALLHSARYQQGLRRYHDRHVRERDLNVGDLVLRRNQNTMGRHKLTPPWEGPYIIAEVLKLGTYKLSNKKGEILTNAWNIEQLRRFFKFKNRFLDRLRCKSTLRFERALELGVSPTPPRLWYLHSPLTPFRGATSR